ncbi:EAL domain-containing protein [Caulobacter sp. CCNWLY153]
MFARPYPPSTSARPRPDASRPGCRTGGYVQALRRGSRDAVLLKHIVALCCDLGMTTIAEMVETRDAANLLRDLGVELGQGWHFAKPLPKPQWRAAAPPLTKRMGTVDEWR